MAKRPLRQKTGKQKRGEESALEEDAVASAPREAAKTSAVAVLPPQTGMGPRVGPYYHLRFNDTAAPARPSSAPTAGLAALKYTPLNANGEVTLR